MLKSAEGLSRIYDVKSSGSNVNRSVNRIEEVEVVGVPFALMKTAYDFTEGWKEKADAAQVNMFLVHPSAVITPVSYAISRLDEPSAMSEGKYIYFEESFEDVFILNKKKGALQFHITPHTAGA